MVDYPATLSGPSPAADRATTLGDGDLRLLLRRQAMAVLGCPYPLTNTAVRAATVGRVRMFSELDPRQFLITGSAHLGSVKTGRVTSSLGHVESSGCRLFIAASRAFWDRFCVSSFDSWNSAHPLIDQPMPSSFHSPTSTSSRACFTFPLSRASAPRGR